MNLREIFSEKAPEIRIVDGDHIFVEDRSAEIIKTTSIVDDNGYIILSDVGKIKAAGLTLNELRSKIALLIEKSPNSRNEFQINITDFLSQSCILSIPGKETGVIPISNKPISLYKLLVANGLSSNSESIVRIKLKRKNKTYSFTLDDLLKLNESLYLRSNDRIIVEILQYKKNKVFVVGRC